MLKVTEEGAEIVLPRPSLFLSLNWLRCVAHGEESQPNWRLLIEQNFPCQAGGAAAAGCASAFPLFISAPLQDVKGKAYGRRGDVASWLETIFTFSGLHCILFWFLKKKKERRRST